MPGRASSGSRPSSFFSSSSHRPTTSYSASRPAPAPAPTPVQTIQVTQSNPGFFSSMVSGFGWGAGTTIARNLFATPTPIITSRDPSVTLTAYDQCMKDNNYDDLGCQHLKEKKSSS